MSVEKCSFGKFLDDFEEVCGAYCGAGEGEGFAREEGAVRVGVAVPDCDIFDGFDLGHDLVCKLCRGGQRLSEPVIYRHVSLVGPRFQRGSLAISLLVFIVL